MSHRFFVGIDSGGTFTDVVAFETQAGAISTLKVSSTPHDPAEALFNGLRMLDERLGIQLEKIERLIFGTTVATNAILEYTGASTALITTSGNRDMLEIQRQNRRRLYDLLAQKPKPLVPRRWSLGVAERVGADGEVVTPLEDEEIDRVVELVRATGVESVAVSFLFSFLRPDHERRLGEAIRSRIPGLNISLSSEVSPEFREYERTSTVVANAYVMPKIDRLATRLEEGLQAISYGGGLRIIQSNGGLMNCEQTRAYPVRTLLSGPAGGVVGASALASLSDVNDVITIDMGGTSFDVSIVRGGQVQLVPEGQIGGFPVKVPQVDVHTIGAGGGSIARFHRGTLQVGPASAGAVPGPVCYQRGGTEPTSTDAAVALGYIDPNFFLGGEIVLDAEAARAAIESKIAKPLDLDVSEAAMAVVQVQVANMSKGIRAVTVEKGLDPREFVLMPFGGAGSLYAGLLAEEMGIRSLLVPVHASVLSALGMLMTDVKYTQALTRRLSQDEILPEALEDVFSELGRQVLDMFSSENIEPEAISLEYFCDIRYVGQGFEINIPCVTSSDSISSSDADSLIARFHSEHRRLFGHADEDEPIEIMSFRLVGIGRIKKSQVQPLEARPAGTASRPKGERRAYFGRDVGWVRCPTYDRRDLRPDDRIEGPGFIEDTNTVIVLFPGHLTAVDRYGNLHVEIPNKA